MRLHGWHRVGIVLSVLWLLTASGGYFYELIVHPSSLAPILPSASYEWIADPDATAKAHIEGRAQGKDFSYGFMLLKPAFNGAGFALLVLAPVVIAWLLAYLLRATLQWVRKRLGLMDESKLAIDRSIEVAKWLAAHFNDLSLDASVRNRASGACLSVAQDHHCAIALLLRERLFASAFALLRLQYESYIRGLWLAHCASDAQVLAFTKGTEPPKIAELLEAIEQREAFASGTLSRFKAEMWSAMCSYTHTGDLQIQRWQTKAAIEPNYPPEEICEVANTSASFALLSGIGMATLANNEVLAASTLERSRAFANRMG